MLSKLEAFIEVAKTKNISKAADNLYTSQPSISMKIQGLEKEFGAQFFDRTKKMMHLTEEGKVFLRYAESIYNLFDEVKTIINDFQDLNRGILSVSTGSYYGSYLLPNLLGKFKSKYPKISIRINVALSEVVIQDILFNKHEIGFISQTEIIKKYPHLVCEPFFNDELVFICSTEHPCAKMNTIDLRSLQADTFIKTERSSALRNLIEDIFQKHDIQFNNFIILNNVESIKRSVENNLGVSILPKLSVEREIKLGLLQTIPIQDMALKRKLYYIFRNDKVLSNAAKEFLKMSNIHFSDLGAAPEAPKI